jgi:hypothetical protein
MMPRWKLGTTISIKEKEEEWNKAPTIISYLRDKFDVKDIKEVRFNLNPIYTLFNAGAEHTESNGKLIITLFLANCKRMTFQSTLNFIIAYTFMEFFCGCLNDDIIDEQIAGCNNGFFCIPYMTTELIHLNRLYELEFKPLPKELVHPGSEDAMFIDRGGTWLVYPNIYLQKVIKMFHLEETTQSYPIIDFPKEEIKNNFAFNKNKLLLNTEPKFYLSKFKGEPLLIQQGKRGFMLLAPLVPDKKSE